jgi:peptide/nickel transport system permease protein
MFSTVRDLFRYNREFAIGATITLLVVIFAMASFFAPVPPETIYAVAPDVPPGADYPLGTTSRGQDELWLLSASIRNSLLFGITVALISRVIALAVGLTAGYLGGWVDRVLMSINDTFVVFPGFPILVLIYFVFRDQMSWGLLAISMAMLGWSYDARLIRSISLSLRSREFTVQSLFSGMSTPRILLREHLPYVLPVVFSTTMNNINWSIGFEVTLSVIGFTNLETPTIGTMIYWANQHSAMISGTWWWLTFPVVLVIVMFIGLYLLSVSMNEYIDPRSRLARMGA